MADVPHFEVSRILVICDTSPLGSAALDAAVALARRLNAEIAGLYVEDINLLRLAELPFAREYALASAAGRQVQTVEVERSLRLQADALRKALAHAAQALSVPWSFEVLRGSLLDSVLEAMREPDLAVFGWTGQFAITPGARPAVAAPGSGALALFRPIVTIFDDTLAAQRALGAAQALAQVQHSGVVVLLPALDAADAERLRSRAAVYFQGSPIQVRFQALRVFDCAAIRKAVESHHAAALLWHGVQMPAERKSLATLVDALKCPVVLVQ